MSIRASIRPGCNGMGSCVRLAPAVFRMDATTGTAQVVLDDCEDHREAVLAAARSCPFVAVEVDGVPAEEPIEDAVVLACERLTVDIVELRLRRPGLTFVPGQYVFLRLRDEAGDFFRTYSVVGSEAGMVTLCIRLVPTGRAGRVLAAIKPGTVVGLSKPKGLFTLRTTDQPKLFLTGGTGLAPVIPMCLAAPEARKLVIIGARTPAALFWLERVRALPNTQVIVLVQEADATWQGPIGQVMEPLKDLDLTAWPEIYTCGSPVMVEAVRRTLLSRDVPEDSIFSDSFVPSGSALRPAVATVPPGPPPRDWAGLLRRVHYLASAPLALLILFYAVTGFVANRADLFQAEGTAAAGRVLPPGTSLEPEHLGPVVAAMLPDGCRVTSCTAGTDPVVELVDARGRTWTATVNGTSRAVRLIEHGVLPAGVALQPAAVATALAGTLSGHPDLERAEVGDDGVELDLSSVWGTHHLKVDATNRSWTATTVTPPLVVSLVDIHRSKHAGSLQRLVVDATALGLALLTLTGMGMALMTPVARRRRLVLVLLLVSLLLLVFLLNAR